MTITVTFDPPLPSDSPATFNTKAFATLGDLNTWSAQANALPAEAADAAEVAAAASATAAANAVLATRVTGPASATDNAIARFDGTTGKLVQNSAVTVGDGGEITSGAVTGTGCSIFGTGAGLASGVPNIGYLSALNITSTVANQAGFTVYDWSTTGAARASFARSKSGTSGAHTALSSGDTIHEMRFLGSDGTTFVRAAAIRVDVDGTPGTNNMPGRLVFSTTADGALAPTERMQIDSAGVITMAGPVTTAAAITGSRAPGSWVASMKAALIRSTTDVGINALTMASARTASGYYGLTVSSDIFTINFITTANYDANTNTTVTCLRSDTVGNITTAGDLRTQVVTQDTSPTNSNTSATVTAAALRGGILTGTPTAGISYTLPTGTNMDAAFTPLGSNQAFEWSVINLAGATHVITVVANTGHTLVGTMTVAAATSARFMSRKTAANTFITYRIA